MILLPTKLKGCLTYQRVFEIFLKAAPLNGPIKLENLKQF